jgi:hypothetical protein
MHTAFLRTAVLACLMFVGSALANPFEQVPPRYGALANHVLEHVGSDLRFRAEPCGPGAHVECRFSSERVSVRVEGRNSPPLTRKILIEADLFRDEPRADPHSTVADSVLAFGATMVIFDPDLSGARRVQMLSDLIETALEEEKSEGEGIDARYSLTFDEAASGKLMIAVTPATEVAIDEGGENWRSSAFSRPGDRSDQ